MAIRVYALYQNSRLILILLLTIWLPVVAFGCVRVLPCGYDGVSDG